MTIDR